MSLKRVLIVTETYRPEVNGVTTTLGQWVDGMLIVENEVSGTTSLFNIDIVRQYVSKNDQSVPADWSTSSTFPSAIFEHRLFQ